MDDSIRPGYIRVTETLWPFSGLQNIDKDILQKAANRGTAVHKICEAIILGFGIQVEDETWGYVESFKKWWGDGRDYVFTEKRFYDDEFMITGQCDLIMHDITNKYTLVDFKTSYKESKSWAVQGNAYAYMANRSGVRVNNILFLHLNKQGKDPKELYYERDEELFLSHMKIYNHYWGKSATEQSV